MDSTAFSYDAPTGLHENRISAVMQALLRSEARSVVDLGCGSGALLARLALHSGFARLAGVDASMEALGAAERRLREQGVFEPERVFLYHGSFDAFETQFAGYEAALMVETIEHVDPRRLSAVEHTVFSRMRPAVVLMTTPNREYNVLYDMPEDAFRHPDHRFEWTRARFRSWATRVAGRNGYGVSFAAIGDTDPVCGSPTQMATFRQEA